MTPLRRKALSPDALASKRDMIASQLASASARSAEAREAVTSEVAAVAAAELLGEVTPAEAEAKRVVAAVRLAEAEQTVEKLRAALPALDGRIAEAAAKAHEREVTAATRAYDEALGRRRAVEGKLRRTLREVKLDLGQLQAAREQVASAVAGLEDMGEIPADSDEVWEIEAEALEVLVTGPLAPAAARAEAERRAAETRRRQDDEQLAWLSRDPSRRRLFQLPQRLRDEGRAICEAAGVVVEEGELASAR